MKLLASLLIALSVVANAHAQQKGHPAEVRFADGSVVRLALVPSSLDVQTKYGKLTVPLTDVRKIEMGLHIPEDLAKRIDANAKRLASPVWKERELASKDLLQAGHFALPALRKASFSDAETAARAEELIKHITAKAPPELSSLREEDVIHTVEGPITGTITAPTIAARTEYFGEVDLRLADMRSVYRRIAGSLTMNVDVGEEWRQTALYVDGRGRLTVEASGQVDIFPMTPGAYLVGPKGYNTAGKGGVFLAGSLIGKVGENGRAFSIGERFAGEVKDEGRLYLMIVPSPWNNASTGQFKVRIETK